MPAIFAVRPGIGLEIAGMARSHRNIAGLVALRATGDGCLLAGPLLRTGAPTSNTS